jgi:hypothetical protein
LCTLCDGKILCGFINCIIFDLRFKVGQNVEIDL